MTRLCRVLRWLYIYEGAKLRNLFFIAVVVFAAYQTGAIYYNIDAYGSDFVQGNMHLMNKIANISLHYLVFMMCFGATFAFSTLHRRHAGRQLLLLPASNAEKFAALWFVYVPLLVVVLVLAFIAGDLLRMLILPLLVDNGHCPSAVPYFLDNLWGWLSGQEEVYRLKHHFILQVWALFLFCHALCLLCSVVAGYLGWLLSAVTLYVLADAFIRYYDHVASAPYVLLVLAVGFCWLAYCLFCRYPLFKSLFTLRFHGI
ncbi:MAG: hypothetical protein IJ841_00365 [Prevotella sp.]|nr:hypothetical protein [Prevotella sp.]